MRCSVGSVTAARQSGAPISQGRPCAGDASPIFRLLQRERALEAPLNRTEGVAEAGKRRVIAGER